MTVNFFDTPNVVDDSESKVYPNPRLYLSSNLPILLFYDRLGICYRTYSVVSAF